jgi:uncharacterized protein
LSALIDKSDKSTGNKIRVGLIADTHGLLRPEAKAFMQGSDHIVHAGDIGDSRILDELRCIARTSAVRGNNDLQPWAAQLQESALITVGGVRIYLVHNLADLGGAQLPAGVQVVVSGHSHKPMLERRDHLLFVNPGSAGRRRFKLPVAIGELLIDDECVEARIVDLANAHVLAHSRSARSVTH